MCLSYALDHIFPAGRSSNELGSDGGFEELITIRHYFFFQLTNNDSWAFTCFSYYSAYCIFGQIKLGSSSRFFFFLFL